MPRKSTIGLVRRGKRKVRGVVFLITWDVDSRDRGAVNRLQYFLFGRKDRPVANGAQRVGFVWQEGVRYLAQSAVAVRPHRRSEIEEFLARNGIDYEIDTATFS